MTAAPLADDGLEALKRRVAELERENAKLTTVRDALARLRARRKRVADVFVTDDDRRMMVQLKSKLKIGSLNLYLRSYTPGNQTSGS